MRNETMDQLVVYATDDPKMIAEYRAILAEVKEAGGKLCAAVEGLGGNPDKIYAFVSPFDGPSMRYVTPKGDAPVPEGWRVNADGNWVPARGKRKGAAAREWLAANQPADPHGEMSKRLGLPRVSWSDDGTWRTVKVYDMGDTLWAEYGWEPGKSAFPFAGDEGTCSWPRRKLSEYYAAREAKGA